MRINARLDEEHSRKLEHLKDVHNKSVSDILKQAIDLLYEQNTSVPKKQLSRLLDSEFIGVAEGPESLASDYKQELRSPCPNTPCWGYNHSNFADITARN